MIDESKVKRPITASAVRGLRSQRVSRILGPMPGLKEITIACWACFFLFLVAPAVVAMVGQYRNGEFLKSAGGDFVYVYSTGRLLNEYPADRLYDDDLHRRLCNEVRPSTDGEYGPSPYPPHIGFIFRYFALLPFRAAYATWVCVTLALYITGVILCARRFLGKEVERWLALALALSFNPFVCWTLMNGQLSALGFFGFAAAICAADGGRPVLGGLALSLCAYKPTLLLLVIPMLLAARLFKTLAGFAAGGAALALIPTAVFGAGVWKGYATMLFSFGRGAAGVDGHSFRQLWTYVDLVSFLQGLGARPWLMLAFYLSTAAFFVFLLLKILRLPRAHEQGGPALTWAFTLTWTMFLNAYIPIYDTLLVVLAVIITAGVARELKGRAIYGWFTAIWALCFAASWVTTDIAKATGVQLLTPLLAALGVAQLQVMRKWSEAAPEQSQVSRLHTTPMWSE